MPVAELFAVSHWGGRKLGGGGGQEDCEKGHEAVSVPAV